MSTGGSIAALDPSLVAAGTRVAISAAGQVRVSERDGRLLPLLVVGPYLTSSTTVQLTGSASGEQVELEPVSGEDNVCFVVDWPSRFTDPMLEVRIADAERQAAGVSLHPFTIWNPVAGTERASTVTWDAPPDHGLFHTKLVTADGAKLVIDRRLVLTPSYTALWEWLARGGRYRAIVRGHDGQDVTGDSQNVVLSVDEDEHRRFRELGGAAALAELLTVVNSSDPRRPPPRSLMYLGRADDTPDSAHSLARVLFDALEGPAGIHQRRGALNFGAYETLAQDAARRDGISAYVRDTLEYLALYGVVDRYFNAQGFTNQFLRGVFAIYDFFTPGHAEELLECLRRCPVYREESFAAAMLDGCVLSTYDRDAAAGRFECAQRANGDMWALESDLGAASYLTQQLVSTRARELVVSKRRLQDSLTFLTPMRSWRRGEHMYVCACDPRSFRIYFPFWMNMADYMKPRLVSFHFLLHSDPAEAMELVGTADTLRHRLGALRGYEVGEYADNISFSVVPISEDVTDPIGFYACARFLLARRIGNEYRGPVLMHDVDMFFRTDPKTYLDALDSERISIQLGDPNLAMLKPWRRFLGGTLVVPFSERAHEGLAALEDYVTAGLPLQRSATDQNALTYFVEDAIATGVREQLIAGLGGPRHRQPVQPTAGERIRKVLEPEQRRGEDRTS